MSTPLRTLFRVSAVRALHCRSTPTDRWTTGAASIESLSGHIPRSWLRSSDLLPFYHQYPAACCGDFLLSGSRTDLFIEGPNDGGGAGKWLIPVSKLTLILDWDSVSLKLPIAKTDSTCTSLIINSQATTGSLRTA